MVSRRAFLTGSAALLAGLGLLPAWASPPRTHSRAQFEALLGTYFAVFTGRRVSYGSLVEVRDGPVAPGLDQFTLVFDHVEGVTPGDALYDLWHANIGVFALHLEPTDASASRYIAVFSLPVG
jgi:hypothetical protein